MKKFISLLAYGEGILLLLLLATLVIKLWGARSLAFADEQVRESQDLRASTPGYKTGTTSLHDIPDPLHPDYAPCDAGSPGGLIGTGEPPDSNPEERAGTLMSLVEVDPGVMNTWSLRADFNPIFSVYQPTYGFDMTLSSRPTNGLDDERSTISGLRIPVAWVTTRTGVRQYGVAP